jgi:uncharacterized protein
MTPHRQAADVIAQLSLIPHPEGGYYREMYRSSGTIAANTLPSQYSGARSYVTSIYFLLTSESSSRFHRLRSDELWYFHEGSSLTVFIISPDGVMTKHRVGAGIENGEALQCAVPAESWFAAAVDAPNSYSLISCVVAPGFDFADFELGQRGALVRQFPDHAACIDALTPDPNS